MKNIKYYIRDILKENPYALKKKKKDKKLLNILRHLISYHQIKCRPYRIWYKNNNFVDVKKIRTYEQIPFLPSSVFKYNQLRSNMRNHKIIESSGTNNALKSTLYIDKITSLFQRISLTKILSNTIGLQRKIFFIADVPPEDKQDKEKLPARFAGISGYLTAAKESFYLLKLDQKKNIIINKENLNLLKKIIINEPIIIIGYTYMLWQYIFNNHEFPKIKSYINKDTKIIHFGGWKKLQNKRVDTKTFIEKIQKKINIKNNSILDIYGFSEQLGSVHISEGFSGKKINSYSHILIRDFNTLQVVEDGKIGFMQFISALPLSYPGFSILNDDVGYISKREIKNGIELIEFKILKRLENMEPKGCGDTLPENYYV
jgi:hypothetical protein